MDLVKTLSIWGYPRTKASFQTLLGLKYRRPGRFVCWLLRGSGSEGPRDFCGGRVMLTFLLRSANLFTKFWFTISVLLNPPSQPLRWWNFSWISIERASNRIANTQPKFWTNPAKIANKQNYEQTGISELFPCLFQKNFRNTNPYCTASRISTAVHVQFVLQKRTCFLWTQNEQVERLTKPFICIALHLLFVLQCRPTGTAMPPPPVLQYHPGRNDYKRIPWNRCFCNAFGIFFLLNAECFCNTLCHEIVAY